MDFDFTILREAPIDLFDVEMESRDFFLNLNDYKNDEVSSIFISKGVLESLRIFVANLVEPQTNGYIKDHQDTYHWMVENMGRASRFLDDLEEKTFDNKDYSNSLMNRHFNYSSYSLTQYIKKLEVLFKHLVFNPLKNSIERFGIDYKDENGNVVVKDEDLFKYFVFLELYKSTLSLGNIAYEKKSSSSRSNEYFIPPQENREEFGDIPKDVKIKSEESTEEDIMEKLEEIGFLEEDEEDE